MSTTCARRSSFVSRLNSKCWRAGADGGEHLVRVGGGEHEHHVRRRLLERLQQRVRRAGAEHVHLVDHVHLALAGGREPEMDLVDEIADGLHAVVRRGVEFDEIGEGAGGDRHAVRARAVGLPVGAELEAVQGLGEQAGRGGLAGAAGAGEEVGVAHAVFPQGVAQGGGDVLLALQLTEELWPILAVERLRSHDVALYRWGAPTLFGAPRARSRPRGGPPRRPGGTRKAPLRAASFRT